VVIIVMGTTGAGKTTIGTMLAAQLHWEFADADTFHPPANIDKMSHGVPLNDADRAPWLAAMRRAILEWISVRKNVVLACSALKHAYRNELRAGPEVNIVYLKGNYALFAERIHQRHGHFAGEGILAGQFADLEEPGEGEAIVVDAALTPEEIVSEIRVRLAI
jgi:gluconokinase